ncbi:hypothetical protein POM88_037665 [Heracleum sosnowskyi]|uniref:Protein kinase domain-containing protein n=1 Tax=Heracleum sosnowskyi TaxID=360622 RepID=A0AAD8HRJ4_9APIA|nr:hypothetical protein POM88_037665 [Heracleum sosnowskyi]
MQSDSNLVQYPVDATDTPEHSYWNTATYGRGGGCHEKVYTADSCKNKERRNQYSMRQQENTWLENDPYSVSKWASSTPEIKASADPKTEKKNECRLRIPLVSVSLVALAFMAFVIFGFFTYRNQVRAYKKISAKGNFQFMEDIAPKSFTYAELQKVTNGFQEEIGRGASGTIYKGTLQFNNKVVAVRKLEKTVAEGEKEFRNENNELAKLVTDRATNMIKFERMVRVGLWCILDEPSLRPSMKKVLLMLEGTVDIPVPPSFNSYLTAI